MESNEMEVENEEIIDVEAPFESFQKVEGTSLISQTSVFDEDSNPLPDEVVGKPPEVDYDSIGEFCFESDELALKGNLDYKNALEAMVVLEAQKAKATKDLELLKTLQGEALSDPGEFFNHFLRREKMNFPLAQKIYPIPTVDWSKYVVSGNPSAFCHRQVTLIAEEKDEFRSKTRAAHFQDQSTLKPWTTAEEERLRVLLNEFPDTLCLEERWENIASCLGQRTASEVKEKVRLQTLDVASGKNKASEAIKKQDEIIENADFDLMDDGISLDLKDTPEYQELIILKRVLRKKLDSTNLYCHKGFKCSRCSMEPIVGVRWHCVDCRPPFATDFCNDCNECSYENRIHKQNHRVERIHASKVFLDRDYMHFLGSNHLDPNYMPVA